MIRAFLRRNGLFLVTFGVYLAAALGIGFGLDQLIYQPRKKELISQYTYPALFGPGVSAFYTELDTLYSALAAGENGEVALARFRVASRALIGASASVYRVSLIGPSGETLADEAVDKQARFNGLRNCLWVMRYTQRGGGKRELTLPDGSKGVVSYWFYFTTPNQPAPLVAEIESLTTRFRWITLALVAAWTALTFFFVQRVLRPVRNVADRIERSTPARTLFIARPATRLERLYNQMARSAALTRLQQTLMERVHAGSVGGGWDLIAAGCEALVQSGACDLAAAVEIERAVGDSGGVARAPRAAGDGNIRATGRSIVRRAPGVLAGTPDADYASGVLEALAGGLADDLDAEAPPVRLAGALGRGAVAAAVRDPENPGGGMLIAVALEGGPRRPPDPEAAADLLGQLAAIFRGALQAAVAQSSAMARERDRASVNLSRNLGHDLTNIIATSKLELMTLQRALRGDPPDLSGPRREIVGQSLEGLLNSTKFLQETVNLYRAYAFVKEPVLEPGDLNELLRDTARLFQMSTSGKLAFEMDLSPGIPPCATDPRLIKLALFNLFTNALDALKRAEGDADAAGDGRGAAGEMGATAGIIRLATRRAPDDPDGAVDIHVWDNGPGIRDETGRPLNPAEIEKIFGLGYTVGREGEGEGLGLNWVRTIIREIHQGSIKAENPLEGGARFILRLRAVSTPAGDGPDPAAPGHSGKANA